MPNQFITGIARVLLAKKLLTHEEMLYHQKQADANQLSLPYHLVMQQKLEPFFLATVISQYFEIPYVDLSAITLDTIPNALINEVLIRRYSILPLSQLNTQLYLATDDPSSPTLLQDIQSHTGLTVQLRIARTDQLHQLMHQLLQQQEKQKLSDYVSASTTNHAEYNLEKDDSALAQYVDNIIHQAIRQGASDIHFEPYEQEYRIRYRQDGILYRVTTLPKTVSNRIAARIKILSKLDIAEKRRPQDGRFNMHISEMRSVDCRVSSCPTIEGEKIVIRLLDPKAVQLQIDRLGFNAHQKHLFLNAIHSSQGMILVTGPTGSGKTVTLYTAITHLNTIEKNISTVEDPVEIRLHGINQVNVHPKIGLTFSNVLRAFLRQDPDIMMLGEIRDRETAEIAVKAAQTGHLVLSTLHTNGAVETLVRLANMGIPTFQLASSIRLIIAQRLIRTLCVHCKTRRTDLSSQQLTDLGFEEQDTLYKAVGCYRCVNGYHGRTALFEMLPISKHIENCILMQKNVPELLEEACKEGMQTISQMGLESVKNGISTLEEVDRILQAHG